MAGFHVTSELMNNYVSAEIIPAAKHLVTCFDPESHLPMVFALIEASETPPSLQVIRTSSDGQRISLNLVELLRLPDTAVVQTFDAKQAENGLIFLSVAIKVDNRRSEVWFTKPFATFTTSSLETLPPVETGTVRALRIGPVDVPNRSYPMVYVTHQPLDRTSDKDDISRVEIDLDFENATLWMDLSLPVNAKILDIASGSAGNLGEGLFYLIEQAGKRKLFAKFVRPGNGPGEVGKWATYELPCPPGSCCIESFTDFDDSWKQSILVIGSASGLHWIHVNDFITSGNAEPKILSSQAMFKSPKSLLVVQEKEEISVWAISQQLELISLVTSTKTMSDQRSSILLPANQATVVSPMIYKPKQSSNTRQTLVLNDQHGSLKLLQQSLDTGLWRSEPFYASKPKSKVVEMKTYTINVNVTDKESNPVVQGSVFIKPSSELPVIINGKHEVLSSEGSWHPLDLSGESALIIPTTGVTVQPLEIQKCRDQNGLDLPISGLRVDPSSKILEKLGELTSADRLESATTKDGKSIWDGMEKPSANDLKCAASCFSAIADAHSSLPQDGSKVIIASGHAIKRLKTSDNLLADISEAVMDGFHWVKEKVKDAVNWIVKKAGDVWQFVCEIAGKVKNFVLDCVEKVKEAATWIWEKLKLGWNKLTEFVGFIFSWDDMLETKNTIKGLLNAGLDFAEHKVEGLNNHVDRFFDMMQFSVGEMTGSTAGKRSSTALVRKKTQQNEKDKEAASSTPTKWVNERMKNDKAPSSSGKPGSKDDEAVNLWEDRITPLVDDIIGTAEQLGKDIAQLFKGNHDMSTEELLKQLGGNLIINVLQVLRQLIKTVVSTLAKLIGVIKGIGNAPIEWGFLGSLYRWLVGSDLSIFDAVSLLIAIPSTIIIKLVTGKKPPNLGTIDKHLYLKLTSETDEHEKQKSKGEKKIDKSKLYKDAMTIALGCGCGVAVIKLGYDKVKLLYKIATQGLSAGVGSLSPGTVMEIISMCLDAFSIIQELIDPAEPDQPGAAYREYVTYVKCGRLAINALYMLATKLGFENPAAEQVMLCIDLLTTLINFSLNTAIALEELDATQWEDYDEDATLLASTDNFLEAVTAIGYFAAFTFKEKNPPATAVGLICMQVAGVAAVVTKSAAFRLTWDSELK